MGGRLWRAAELEVAREMMVAGNTCEDIANALNRTPCAVISKLYTAFGVGVKKVRSMKTTEDSQERLDADIERIKSRNNHAACEYMGNIPENGFASCTECVFAVSEEPCVKLMARDIARRAKEMAGVR